VGINEGVKSIFDRYADQYNQSRRKLIPYFDDFYRIAVEIIPLHHKERVDICDDLDVAAADFSPVFKQYLLKKVVQRAYFQAF
jgi:hypothetical protein